MVAVDSESAGRSSYGNFCLGAFGDELSNNCYSVLVVLSVIFHGSWECNGFIAG